MTKRRMTSVTAPRPHRSAPRRSRQSHTAAGEKKTVAVLERELEAARRQLTEALEQQSATSEVLRVISSSPGELEPVFQTMLANAVRICEAKFGNLLLYEVAASDAWPLMGVKDFDEFNSRLLTGDIVLEPRMTDVPVRMPLPPAKRQGSIYENQSSSKKSYFTKAA